ncbi:MAG: MMPL family transporter [Nakamurella sp.]
MPARHRRSWWGRSRAAVQLAGRRYRAIITRFRWVVVIAWVALATVLSLTVPTSHGGGGSDVGSLLPPGSAAGAVQARSLAQFAIPVLSETTVVIHDPGGLSLLTRADAAVWALSFVQASQKGLVPEGPGHIVAAVPVPTVSPNTAVAYLYASAYSSLQETTSIAQQYAAHFNNQPSVSTYVTGIAPAQLRQGYYLQNWLPVFEVATLALIAIVVAWAFRSVVAPLAVLAVAGLGYLVTIRVLGLLAAAFGFALPDQLQPLIAALLIGVVTDYCVLFFFAFRRELRTDSESSGAVQRTLASDASIVAVAGLTVAAGTAALLSANFDLFRAFGPALSATVVVGLLVSLTLVPALMTIAGRWLFLSWRGVNLGRADLPGGTQRANSRLVRIVVDRRGAAMATAIAVGVLVLAAVPLSQMRLDLSFTSGLPSDDRVQRGAQILDSSGIRGITAPTEVLVEGTAVADQRDGLRRMQALIAAQPGVATVLGPEQNPLPDQFGIVYSKDGNAARFLVVLDSDPLGGDAIATLDRLSPRWDSLMRQAGIENASVAVTGQTAIASELAEITRANLWITLLAALAVELVILIAYLRSVVAPLALLVCSALGVAAALGLTVLVFQGILDDPGLTFYEPFATAVLLLALGSDYNVFVVGSIWSEAARHPLSQALARAMPATAKAVGTAGLILAATFAMVAVIPLGTFRQLAFTMAVGLLIDTFLIRPVLTPAVLTLLGRWSGWPGSRIRTTAVSAADLHHTAVQARQSDQTSPTRPDLVSTTPAIGEPRP